MSSSPTPLLEPPPEIRFRRPLAVRRSVAELWARRELIRTLAERQLRAQYNQALLGLGWAVLMPLLLMVVFTLFFRRVANLDTDGIPYPLFSYLALVPWSFFTASVQTGVVSLVKNQALVNKVACPREVYPLATVVVAAIHLTISMAILAILFVVFRRGPAATAPLAIIPFGIQLAFIVGVVLILAAVTVYVRDLVQIVPAVMQLALFATPIAYPLEVVPPAWRLAYAFANPLAPVLEAYRDLILHGSMPDWSLLGAAAVSSFVLLAGGYALFKRMETGMADIA